MLKWLKIILVAALCYVFYHYFLEDIFKSYFEKNKEQVEMIGTETTFDKVLQDSGKTGE